MTGLSGVALWSVSKLCSALLPLFSERAPEVRHFGNVDTLLVTEHFGGDVVGLAGDGGIEIDLLYQGYDMVELSGRFGEV